MAHDVLFQPFRRKGLTVRNRIGMSSMARWSTPGRDPTPLADFYRRRIEGGTGVIFTEGLAIGRPTAGNDDGSPPMHGPTAQNWRTVTDAVHGAGGAVVAQLWHCGATIRPGRSVNPPDAHESPSGRQGPGAIHGRAMTEADIEAVIQAYADAAKLALSLGFDAVEVHAGHGYLLDQFFWAETNRRTDRWGGDALPERASFALEVIRAIRAAIGPDACLSMRVSQWKSISPEARLVETPDEITAWLAPFRDAGVDLFNSSQLRYDEPAFPGSALSLAAWIRKLLDVPTVVAGGVGMSDDFKDTFGGRTAQPQPLDDVVRRLEAGEFDLVSVGRGMLADPDWANRVRSGEPRSPLAPEKVGPGLD